MSNINEQEKPTCSTCVFYVPKGYSNRVDASDINKLICKRFPKHEETQDSFSCFEWKPAQQEQRV